MDKKTVVISVFLTLSYSNILFAVQKTKISLPIRIISGKRNSVNNITSADLKLFVNKKEVKIDTISKKERIFGVKNFLGKNYIFSFGNFLKYHQSLSKGISYFITELLDPSDSLIIVVGEKFFQIKITKNRERIIYNIDSILKNYFRKFSLQMSGISKSITSDLFRLEDYFEKYDSRNTVVSEGQLYFEILTKISTEVDFFKKGIISPTKEDMVKAEELLGLREGDRIWIHFQNSNIYPFGEKLRESIRWIKYHMSMTTIAEKSWQKVISSKIQMLEQSLLVSSEFPSLGLKQILTETNTSFSTVFIKMSDDKEGISSKIFVNLYNIYSDISLKTGGMLKLSDNAETALRQMVGYKDIFFIIRFNLNEEIGNKTILIIPKRKSLNILYRKNFTSKQFVEIVKYNNLEKIELKSYKIRNREISFEISSFLKKKDEKIGLIKILIDIFDLNSKKIYSTSNILRANKKKIHINARLPSFLKGKFSLKLTFIDLISNRKITKESQVILTN